MYEDRWENWFQPGERLRWEGAPVAGRVHWLRNIFFTCFGIPFLFGGLMTAAAALGFVPFEEGPLAWGMMIFLLAFSVPFLAVGGGLVFGTWVFDYLKPRRTRYALTDRAGYVATNYWHRNMDVIPVKSGVRVEFEETGGGAGNVFFHFQHYKDSDGDSVAKKRGFENIPDAKKVYDLVRKLKANAGPEFS